jgi:hypothetical protein
VKNGNTNTVSNTGTANGTSGGTSALGQLGNNTASGEVDMVGAAGGGSGGTGPSSDTKALNDQKLWKAIDDAMATATSGSVTVGGLTASVDITGSGGPTFTTGGSTGSAISTAFSTTQGSVTIGDQGTANGLSGLSTATGHSGNNSTPIITGTVDAAGGATASH